MSSMGSVEVTVTNGGWNGDFEVDDTGDLVLSFDTGSVPQATTERLTRLVMTTPNLSFNGNVIGWADDIFHVNWGAGLRAYVDENFSASDVNTLIATISAKVQADPEVDTASIAQSLNGSNEVVFVISFATNNGQSGVLPQLTLTPGSVQVG